MFSIGDKIRLKENPNKKGLLQEKLLRGNRVFWEVLFADSKELYPETKLEKDENVQVFSVHDLFVKQKFSDIEDLKRMLIHIKINGRMQDILYSMGFTNTEFLTYQFKPVIKILNSLSNGLLIADEVGLGKTIEAGLIWTELRHRFNLKKLFVVCPNVLCEKWKREFSQKMGIRAEIVNADELLKLLKDPYCNQEFALISSLQSLRPRKRKEENDGVLSKGAAALYQYLREQEDNAEKIFDMLVVDEAHYMRNRETQTNKIGTLLRNVSDYAVLMSATPIQNKDNDLHSLLYLLDKDSFEYPDTFRSILEENKNIVALRDELLKGQYDNEILNKLIDIKHTKFFQENKQLEALIEKLKKGDLSKTTPQKIAYELENIQSLGYIYTRTRKRDIKENRVLREPIPEYIDMTPNERKAYELITQTVCEYGEHTNGFANFMLCMPQRMLASCLYSTLEKWKQKSDFFSSCEDEDDEWSKQNTPSDMMNCIYGAVNSIDYMDDLRVHDSKFDRLIKCLKETFKENKNEKIVIFSSFVVTLEYLKERLTQEGFSPVLLTGKCFDKDSVLTEFSSKKHVQILLASEVGSEGVDLQFCRFLINYDLPWNPMRLEQRIGRLDRIGQKSEKIVIWNMLHQNTIDQRIYDKLYTKLNICKEALGSFEKILGTEIRKLTQACFNLTQEDQDEMIEQTKRALENQKIEQEKLEAESEQFIYFGDLICQQIEEMNQKNKRITNDDLKHFVLSSLHQFDKKSSCVPLENGNFQIKLSADFKLEYEEFCRKERMNVRNAFLTSLSGVKCSFDNRIASLQKGTGEIINQTHSLVKFLANKYSQTSLEEKGGAFAISVISRDFPQDDFVLGATKIHFEGVSSYDKIVYSARSVTTGEIFEQAEDLFNVCLEKGENWLDRRNLDYEKINSCAQEVRFDLLDASENIIKDNQNKNSDKADFQILRVDSYRQKENEKFLKLVEGLRNGSEKQQKAVKMMEGKRDKLNERLDMKIARLKKQKEGREPNKKDLCLALICVCQER